MDKTETPLPNVEQRNGFALLVTLSVLTVLISLTTILLGYLDKTREDASETKALIQANLYYSDISEIFNGLKEKKRLFSALYSSPFPLVSEDGRFSMLLDCKPLSNGVNINWLGEDGNPKKNEAYAFAQTVFDSLAEEYNLVDPTRLLEMLLESIKGEEEYARKPHSRLLQNNGIISYQQFTDIVSRYQFEIDDDEVSQIAWEKYFSFSPRAEFIDADYSSPELISILFDINIQTIQEWYDSPQKDNLKNFITVNGGNYDKRKKILSDGKFLEESECYVSYASSGNRYKFRFEYIRGEAKYFEFYGKQ